MSADNSQPGLEPIAIVGMGCRFSGDSSSPSKLWDMLKDERSGQSDFPKNRFDIDSWYHPTKGRPGSLYTKGGYFLSHDDSYRNFDPSFFGISPLEAASMDPQQRKLLEVVYECFESAGKTLEEVSGSEIACYVGCFNTEFSQMQSWDPEYRIPYQPTGTGLTILSNRINYVFNLKGPSLTVDTACSSSLYALHLACQSLLAGDCTAAVVGGSNLVTSVEKQLGSESLGVLSPSSTCHTFDESADGFGRGDGIAALYIKRLSNAISDGDPIRAIIRATAINSNGKGPGINHPGPEAQEAVIRKAYAKAGLGFSQTGYFECHGTGTAVGDPIECAAIGNVFAEDRTPEDPLLIGSIKTNLGHCEGASGLAAIIKAVYCLENACIPATIGVKRLNPNIDFKNGRLRVVCSLTPWPKARKYRRVSVNGFGYGGANAHVILDATDSFLCRVTHPSTVVDGHKFGPRNAKRYILAFSAHDQATLVRNRDAILSVASKYEIPDLAYTLAAHRSKFRHREFSIWDNDRPSTGVQDSKFEQGVSKNIAPDIAFVFTGQGAQWAQMCYPLIEHFPSVRRTFEQLEASLSILPTPPNFSIIEVLSAPKGSTTLYHSVRSPVCCTAVQIALTVLLQSWGVRPTAVVGHSAGEIASAFAAGLITGAEAVAIAYYRGLAVLNCKVEGAMLAVGLGAEKVLPYLEGKPDVIIGCYNSPQSVTLSGGEHAIDEVRRLLTDRDIFARKVNTSGNAYHSHLMKSAAKEFTRLFEGVYTEMVHSPTRKITVPRVPLYSCITGELFQLNEMPFGHWHANLELPVLFDQATRLLLVSQPAINYFVEIGPHSALAGPIRQITASLGFDQARLTYLPSLIRGQDGVDNMLHLAGTLFNLGCPVDLVRVNAIEIINPDVDEEIVYKSGKLLVDIPNYQWNYGDLLWKETRWSRELYFRKHCHHDILGSREPGGSQNSYLWRNHLQIAFVPWLRDHKIANDFIFPAAGYIAMAFEALMQVANDQCLLSPLQGYAIQGLNITSALIIPSEGSIETLVNVMELRGSTRDTVKWFDFRVSSVTEDGKWAEHAAGMISLVERNGDPPEEMPLIRRNKVSNARNWYAALSTVGVEFGPTFQTLSDISLVPDKNEAIANIALHTTKKVMTAESRYVIHPTTLDGCLQMSVMAAHGSTKSVSKAFLPVSVEDLTVWTPSVSDPTTEDALIYAQGKLHGLRSAHGIAKVFSKNGRLLVNGRVSFLSLEGSLTNSKVTAPRQPYSRLVWKPDVDRMGTLANYFDDHHYANTSLPGSEKFHLAGFIDLLVHKGRSLRILQVGCGSLESTVKALHGDSSQPLYSQYMVVSNGSSTFEEAKTFQGFKNLEFCSFDVEGSITEQTLDPQSYDLIFLSETHDITTITIQQLKTYKDMLKSNGKILMDLGVSADLSQTSSAKNLAAAGLSYSPVTIGQSQSIVLCEPTQTFHGVSQDHEKLWLVYKENPHPLNEEIATIATQCGISTSMVSLLRVAEIPKRSKIIVTAETEGPLLTRMNSDELGAVQDIVKHASSAVWVTNGGLLDGFDPEKSLAAGFAKTLMNEQPSLRLSCFDIDPLETNLARSAAFIVDQHIRLQDENNSEVEMYLAEKNGLVYISRFLLDDVENSTFERRTNPPVEPGKFQCGSSLELDFRSVGQIDSFYYKQKGGDDLNINLNPEDMFVEASGYSLSATEVAILKGQQESEFFSYESVAIIRSIGSKVVGFQPNDRVLALTPGKFDNSFTVNQNLCHKLLPNEKSEDLAGLFVPTCSALYALNHLIRPRKRESILVHLPGDHLLVSMFIQIAHHRNLELFVTYASESDKAHFLETEDVHADHLVPANTPTWARSFKGLAGGQGISAIITSAAAGNHQDLLKHLKKSGQYSLLGGGSNVPNLHTLDTFVFAGGASFITFDILDMLREGDEDVKDLLEEAFELYRSGYLVPRPSQLLFDISKLPDAVSAASSLENHGRVILECSADSTIPCRTTHTPLSFDSSGTFLMIGCLGGLGRSITSWMAHRGARHFVFLSRSGAEKPETLILLNELELYSQKHAADITVQVVRGDVSVRKDVDRAVAAAKMPIKGVIHAAATFQACLFENMTVEKFHEVLDPKVQGTINIHQALFNEPLDFFVMTSSSLGIKGTATQSSYAAANAFMDSMARHRQRLGMQATSLSLGMVQEIGHVEEHPEIETAMLQNGLYGISEAELLAMMELACQARDLSSPASSALTFDLYSNAHIITGLEINRWNLAPGLEKVWLKDRRLQNLFIGSIPSTTTSAAENSSTISILKDAFKSGGQASVKNSVKEIVLKCLSKLLLIPIERLEEGMSMPLADLGMDSMVSSDVRAMAWKEFSAEVAFLKILEKGLLLEELVDLVWEKMDSELKYGAD